MQIHILLHISIFESYFTPFPLLKEETDILIFKILHNEQNALILSKEVFAYFREKYQADKNFVKFVDASFTKWLSRGGKIYKPAQAMTVWDDYFIEIAQTYKANCLLKFLLSKNEKIESAVNEVAIISKAIKPDQNWFKTQLAANGTFSLRYWDFTTNPQISAFFYDLFSLHKHNEIILIGRYAENLNQHHIFHFFENIRPLDFRYYTLNAPEKIAEGKLPPEQKKGKPEINGKWWNDLCLIFGPNMKLFSTSDRNLIHERKIIIGNFVIELDDDIENIKIERQTWKIDITFSPKLVQNIQQKLSQFTPIDMA